MDPFTALGLLSNVLQFLDVARKVLSQARSIQKSGSTLTEDDANLLLMTNNLSTISQKFSKSPPSYTRNGDDSETQIWSATTMCNTTAQRLAALILGVQPKNPKSRWQSLIAAGKSYSKNSEKKS
ncbi:hypothetical protein BX600DRAFT_295872 [Xylariales sp. PMI_506]|nr:hypothetical protein BX600DRAFT_295872 [Xylariales sp. PMI_506]